MNIKHLGFIFFFAFGSTASVQGANLISVKGLAQNIANTSSPKDLHFDKQDSDTTNGSFLNISCTDQNKWITNYGQGYTASLIKSRGSNRNLVSPNKRSRRSLWSRMHSFSY
ncbi:hypothetical protein [Bartonella schoenbuchensis]|uniref:Uncharacterized protein n=2 Tax=Bartonella schoenbuchensis TaxID=165694 RepID=E6YXW1_BARSR|nr:hypothetical protein [Bartonella schoenbuchensis]AQX30135.1 hypothetical protein BscR1v2_001800 [Bartonella schoenbuchensis R1]CBI81699.1 exported hypothetical protein [Bartonella schoenbuchensis R1]CDP79114.1 hypothetical protein BN1046_00002 [Bartonella schoenbuchensis]